MGLMRVATFGHHANIPILLDAARWAELGYMFQLTATNSTRYIHPNQPNPNSTATTFIICVFFRKGCLKIYSTTWPSCSIWKLQFWTIVISGKQIHHHVVYPIICLSWYLKFSVCGKYSTFSTYPCRMNIIYIIGSNSLCPHYIPIIATYLHQNDHFHQTDSYIDTRKK
jgi:hypothetical protein